MENPHTTCVCEGQRCSARLCGCVFSDGMCLVPGECDKMLLCLIFSYHIPNVSLSLTRNVPMEAFLGLYILKIP